MKGNMSCVQLGKQGITENFIETLKTHFKNHGNVKICVLKSARSERDKIKKYLRLRVEISASSKYWAYSLCYTCLQYFSNQLK